MKRREFVRTAAAAPLATTQLMTEESERNQTGSSRDDNEVYELRRYELVHGRPQAVLDAYLQEAVMPALARHGAGPVGVFTEYGMTTPIVMYTVTVHPDVNSVYAAGAALAADPGYRESGRAFQSQSSQEGVVRRYDTWLLRAFDGHPALSRPDTSQDRIFELRTYEGHNSDAVSRKVAMFNTEEIDLFHRTGLHPVFFGKLFAGPRMPALTYMLTFRDMAERDTNWNSFLTHPDWATMRVKPEYADTVNNIIRVFLRPTAYSQI